MAALAVAATKPQAAESRTVGEVWRSEIGDRLWVAGNRNVVLWGRIGYVVDVEGRLCHNASFKAVLLRVGCAAVC